MGKIKCLNCGTELTMISNAACPACGIHLSHVKISFLAYLGPKDSLVGYQRSYKLVLLKSIFEEYLAKGKAQIKDVTERFRSYYLQRKHLGMPADKDVDSRIADIENSSIEDVFEVIKMNPYNAIHKQGFLKMDELNGIFVFQRGIDDLSETEIRSLLDLIQEKLKLYYQKIGSEALPAESMETTTSEQGEEQEEPVAEYHEEEITAEPLTPRSIADAETAEHPIPDYSLEDLNLSNRAYNALRRSGVHTADELTEVVLDGKVRGFKNIGAATVAELEGVVESLRNGTFTPGMAPSMKQREGKAGIPALLKIDDTIDRAYPENGFNLFRQYCALHNIHTIADLAEFDFDLLISADGFGAAKVERVKARYFVLAQNLGLSVRTVPTAESSAKQAFERIHESNLNLPVSTLRLFGCTSKTLNTLQEAGIITFYDLQKAGHGIVVKLVGKQKSAELCEILKTFTVSLHEIGAAVLDDCAKDRSFEIYIQRADGDSLQVIADAFGLTRERIRQICLKFEQRILPIMQTIAEEILARNGAAYFTEEQILDVFDDDNYDKVIVAALKNSSQYTYLDFAKTFVRNEEYPNAENALQELAAEIIGDGINLFEKIDEIETSLSAAGYKFITADSFLDLLIKYNYKFYGDYVIRTRKSYGLLCAEIVAEGFPDGIRTNEDQDIDRLRSMLEAKYGKLDVPESNRSFISRVTVYLVQRGRSEYIAPQNIIIDDNVLLDMKAFIDNATQQDIYYSRLFAEYEGILMMTSNIDNPGFLHGVLVWRFPDAYVYSRDYLKKPNAEETASLAEQIRDVLAEAGQPLSKKQIMGRFPGLTDAMFNNAFSSVPWLIQWEYGVYNCSDNLKITEEEAINLHGVIDKLLEENDGYCSQGLLYKYVKDALPELCSNNYITSAQNIFYTAAYLFADIFDFNRPHLASKGKFAELDVKNIAMELLGHPIILRAEDFFALARKYEWSDVTAGFVFSNIEKEYVRLDKNTYQRAENFILNEEDLKYISDLLPQGASDEWYLPLQSFADSDDYTPNGIRLNEFVMNTIVSKYGFGWHIVSPQAKDRRYEKGVLVRDNQDITAYDELIAQVLSEAGIHELTASQLLSFLQIHQLTFKTIPKELELSERFEVSEDQFKVVQKQES